MTSVVTGSRILAGRLAAWVTAPAERDDRRGRLGGVATAVVVAGAVACRYPAEAIPGEVGGWLVTAAAVAPRTPRAPKAGDEPGVEPEAEFAVDADPTERQHGDHFVRFVLASALAAQDDGQRGVHLAALADGLADATGDTWTTGSVKEWCEASGLPVRRQVKLASGNRSGIHLDDLQQALGGDLRAALRELCAGRSSSAAEHPASAPLDPSPAAPD